MPTGEIQPSALKIDRLVSRISEGDIKIPAFQRGFVWDQDQIIQLLDSWKVCLVNIKKQRRICFLASIIMRFRSLQYLGDQRMKWALYLNESIAPGPPLQRWIFLWLGHGARISIFTTLSMS